MPSILPDDPLAWTNDVPNPTPLNDYIVQLLGQSALPTESSGQGAWGAYESDINWDQLRQLQELMGYTPPPAFMGNSNLIGNGGYIPLSGTSGGILVGQASPSNPTLEGDPNQFTLSYTPNAEGTNMALHQSDIAGSKNTDMLGSMFVGGILGAGALGLGGAGQYASVSEALAAGDFAAADAMGAAAFNADGGISGMGTGLGSIGASTGASSLASTAPAYYDAALGGFVDMTTGLPMTTEAAATAMEQAVAAGTMTQSEALAAMTTYGNNTAAASLAGGAPSAAAPSWMDTVRSGVNSIFGNGNPAAGTTPAAGGGTGGNSLFNVGGMVNNGINSLLGTNPTNNWAGLLGGLYSLSNTRDNSQRMNDMANAQLDTTRAKDAFQQSMRPLIAANAIAGPMNTRSDPTLANIFSKMNSSMGRV